MTGNLNQNNVGVTQLQQWLAAHEALVNAQKPLLSMKVRDLPMPLMTGKKVGECLTFGTSQGGWPTVIVGDPASETVWSSLKDFGSGAVNAIRDFLLIQEYESVDILRHVKMFNRAKPMVSNVDYRKAADGWHRYSWIGYSFQLDDPSPDADLEEDKDYDNHIVNLNGLHNEITALVGTLSIGMAYQAQFSGSNADRCKLSIVDMLDRTLEEARAEVQRQRDVSSAASQLRKRSQKKGDTPAIPVVVDGIDLTSLPLPFSLQITTQNGISYIKVIRNEVDVKFLRDNADLVAEGKLKMVLKS